MNPKAAATSPLVLFLSDTYTKNQALKRLRLVEDFTNYKLFRAADADFPSALEMFKKQSLQSIERANIEADLGFLEGLGEQFFNYFKPNQLSDQFKQFEDGVSKTKTVILYVPYEIPDQELKRLGVWFKSTLGLEVLFEARFDGSLIGGCALSYRGVYKDFSIKAKIESQKQQIIDTLLSFKK